MIAVSPRVSGLFAVRFENSILTGSGHVVSHNETLAPELTKLEIDVTQLAFDGVLNTLEMWVDRHQIQKQDNRFFVWLLEDEFVMEVDA